MGVLIETTMTLAQAARRLPNNPHPCTLWRWCRKGCRGVRLEYGRLGRTIVTSLEAIDRFMVQLREIDDVSVPAQSAKSRTPSERIRQADIAKAYRELEEAGVLKKSVKHVGQHV